MKKQSIIALVFFLQIEIGASIIWAQTPNRISIKIPGLTPEGITVHPVHKRFIVSSVGNGNLIEVDEKGNTKVFADDPALISTLGTHIDPTKKFLVTAICDIGVSQRSVKAKFGQVASIAFIDLKTQKVTKVIDCTSLIPNSGHFANDVTWDDKGNLYVTDSFAGAIYKVDKSYHTSVFIADTTFRLKNQYSFGLNGIAFDKKTNSLLVSKLDEGKLFKFSVSNPKNFREILLEKPIPADGILLSNDGSLILVSSINTPNDTTTSGKIYKVQSKDQWNSAQIVDIVDTGMPSATTITQRGKELFTVHANYFGKQPVAEFHIQKVSFKK